MYTIGQVSERFDLPVSTLRYYDKEGLFPNLTRTSGARRFGEQELEALRVIECLKRSGLEIREIRQFMEWCAQGSDTYPQRHALFVRQEVKLLLRELRRTNPGVEKSIFHSIHSVCLDTMVGYKTGGVEHTFADCYRERGEMTQEDET